MCTAEGPDHYERDDVTEASLGGEVRTKRAIPEWLFVLGVGVIGMVIFTIPYWFNPYFYYIGDNPESFVPNWHHFGEMLRAGHWPIMESSGWYGGNYAGEAAYSVWNPISLLNFVIVSLFNDLSAGAAFVMIEYMTLLAMGAYLLGREYNASRIPAAVVAIAIPLTGFTLYYEASGWPAGLAAFMYATWFWWAARRFARGASSPLLPFLVGVLAMTNGNPYVALGLLIIMIGVLTELLVRKEIKRFWHVSLMGVCVGAVSALAFLPLLGALPVTDRQELAAIANDTFMVPSLTDLAASSAPTFLPAITNWGGAVRESLPSTYFLWFAIPLLPWLRWKALRKPARSLISLFTVTGVYAVLVLGPSNLWLFRWPIRLIEYLYLGLGVTLAVLLSAGLHKDKIKQRTLATAGLIGVGAYLSFAVRPEYSRMHLLATIAVLVFVFALLHFYRKKGWVGAGAVMLVGTVAVVTYQSARIPYPGVANIESVIQPATSVSRIKEGTKDYQGAYLQLAQQVLVGSTADQDDGEISFGNISVVSGHESVTRYSGIGFSKFFKSLCMDYKGSVCKEAYQKIWRPLKGTDTPLIDAYRIQTLVLQNKLYPEITRGTPPAGWKVALRDNVRTVWTREAPLPHPGRVAWTSSGLQVQSLSSGGTDESIKFTAPGNGGEVVFARLAWPGYTATIDGKKVELIDGDAGLITVKLPPGEHTLALEYVAPGSKLGLYILIGAAGVAVVHTFFWWRSRRRDRDSSTPDEPKDDTAPSADNEPALAGNSGT
ncbi:hypothetical protein AOZ06_00865 [Kibdelosporangium phytohabitans]|uniref:YfhO family protein n=1 Tax=Kibdelosporangium phytohabitans TaxID=860235 RepID=A0A0N9HV17_9PSEU|nr:hypothetical protein AOZ06_00865 [Kibdelosporangium phytohabitans]